MLENKNHWYDGWFYDFFIAPNQDRLFVQIKDLIEPDSKLIDVGCGTGRFSFSVLNKCKSVLGIDLSKKNIERANSKLSKKPNNKITFRHTDVNELIYDDNEHFDYAVITYVIHEVDEDERVKLLERILLIADKIIVGDYLVPKPKGFWGLINELVEFAAGKDHYKNYKSYVRKNGINGLAVESGLNILKEIYNKPATSHIVVISKEK